MRFRSWTGALALLLAANFAFAQGSAWTLLEDALKQFRAGKLTRAEQLFEAAVLKDGRCQDAYYYLGVIAEKRKMSRKAIKYYARAPQPPRCGRYHCCDYQGRTH